MLHFNTILDRTNGAPCCPMRNEGWPGKSSIRLLLGVAWVAMLAPVGGLTAALAAADPPLFESRQLTPPGEYTSGIEGPAVDAFGTLYVVNFKQQGMIGKVSPGAASSELFATLPPGSIGNGIRFDRDGRMYVADFKNHNVFVFERGQTTPRVYFHSDGCPPSGNPQPPCFNQPNDLAIAADGTLYASDPSFGRGTGKIWRITRGPDGLGRGEVMSSEELGVTNGLDLSPDGATLYISESNTRKDCSEPPSTARCVFAYRLEGAKLTARRLVKKFDAFDLDGLRTDLDGKVFVTRLGNGTVAVLTPDGALVREIRLRGKEPTNLTFGGPDGKTVFVTQGAGRFIETFRVDRPGREPCLQVSTTC
jgi:sugar lactone lactonase YvrE